MCHDLHQGVRDRSWEDSAGTHATGGRSEGATGTDQGSPGAPTPATPATPVLSPLSLNPQVGFANGMSQFDADPIERRQWLSSDVGTGRSNAAFWQSLFFSFCDIPCGAEVSPASPSADPGDRSEPGYSDNWDEESPKSQPSPGTSRSRRERNGL
eukprot:symbB.v1.2.017720.t1/scaffold1384.1/size122353/10